MHFTSALDILWPAFIAGLLVVTTHVPLGFEVLKRGIIFIDLAIAQVASLGVILADTYIPNPQGWHVQSIAIFGALLAAVFLHWAEKIWPSLQEAIIGLLFVFSASTALLLVSQHAHGTEQLKELLAGQILWVDNESLIPVAISYAAILLLWFFYKRIRKNFGFYVLFAITVTISVQLVGIYLVFATLIIPALSVHSMKPAIKLYIGYVIGLLGYFLGLLLSTFQDFPTGPVIVISLTLVSICVSMTFKYRFICHEK